MSADQSASGDRGRQLLPDAIQPWVLIDLTAVDSDDEGKPLNISLAVEDRNQGGPATATRRRFRLRGACLWHIGTFYPEAKITVHRMSGVAGTDYQAKGHNLYRMRSCIDEAATFRVQNTECDAPNETNLFWIDEEMAAKGYTGDDFVHILELSPDEETLGKMMMITVYKKGTHAWGVVRQIPGKQYSLGECLDLLQVPTRRHGDIQGFGEKTWDLSAPIPEMWVGKDLCVGNVANKIHRIMKA